MGGTSEISVASSPSIPFFYPIYPCDPNNPKKILRPSLSYSCYVQKGYIQERINEAWRMMSNC